MKSVVASVSAAALLTIGCGGGVSFTPDEMEKIKKHSPLGEVPADPTNKYADNAAAAALGQKFFHEKSYSGPLAVGDDGTNGALGKVGETGKVGCVSCHSGPWMIDTRSRPGNISIGAGILPRNATSVVNSAYYSPFIENDGVRDSSWADNIIDIEFDLSLNSSRLRLVHVIHDKYKDEYNAVFDPDLPAELDPAHPNASRFPAEGRPGTPAWDNMDPADQKTVNRIMVNFGKAMQAYFRKLVSKNSAFDRFVAGDESAIDDSAKRGLKLFVGKAGCAECHAGPAFTDNEFHNLGMKFEGPNTSADFEAGRYGALVALMDNEFRSDGEYSDDPAAGAARLKDVPVSKDGNTWIPNPSEKGKWRTKSLRNVAETAPYMHNGQFKTLREVVEFYNDGGHKDGFEGTRDEKIKPLNLTDEEIDDLVAFLKTLTGEQVPAELLEDTSKK